MKPTVAEIGVEGSHTILVHYKGMKFVCSIKDITIRTVSGGMLKFEGTFEGVGK